MAYDFKKEFRELYRPSGKPSVEEAVQTIKRRTRNYAKRQLSWIRRDGRARVLDMDALSAEEACELVVSGLGVGQDDDGGGR